ncbi:MAG: FMN-binding protein [Lachnospiraceae bacterium]|nr:FMN-binding protein [Lachnospiraceae bacterium]
MKKSLKIVLIVVVVIVALGAVMFGFMGKKSKEALDKQVNVEIDMEKVADGVYRGSSDGGMVKVEAEVEVKDHRIVNINLLKHECGKGKPAESMIDEMVKNNTDDVDAVSGATVSSRTIRNAVNQALQKGVE